MNDPVLEVTDDILFRGRFVTVAFQGSADKISRAEADGQGECEHDAAEKNAKAKSDNAAGDPEMIEHHGGDEDENQPLGPQA